jgi:hypothetical protein
MQIIFENAIGVGLFIGVLCLRYYLIHYRDSQTIIRHEKLWNDNENRLKSEKLKREEARTNT